MDNIGQGSKHARASAWDLIRVPICQSTIRNRRHGRLLHGQGWSAQGRDVLNIKVRAGRVNGARPITFILSDDIMRDDMINLPLINGLLEPILELLEVLVGDIFSSNVLEPQRVPGSEDSCQAKATSLRATRARRSKTAACHIREWRTSMDITG
jgi:hypothetical protein